MTIGKQIRKKRRERDYTQEQLAERIKTEYPESNIPYQLISKYERDLHIPSKDNLYIIANVLGCEWVLEDKK